jgi:hypothetical protein
MERRTPVEIIVDSKAVSRLAMAQMAVASVSINMGAAMFWWVAASVLLKAAHVEVEVEETHVTAVVQDDNQMDYNDEDGGLCLFFGCCGRY